MRDGSPERKPTSLTQLPLNVLFQIICFLDMEDLRNVSKSCRMLRILANENLILSNHLVELHKYRNEWTQRLLFDVFDILNGSRRLLMKLTLEHNVSIFESVRYIQDRYDLAYSASGKQMLLLRNEDPDFVDDVRNANEDYVNDEGKTNTKNCERETLTYLKILQGFHNLAIAAPDRAEQAAEKTVKTPMKKDDDDTAMYETNLKQTRTVSPTASNYSRSSAASIFSDLPPKLSDRGWHSSIYELEHVSDDADACNSDGDSSSSTESIVRLRNSTKVKDKAALFEKLFSRDYEISKSPKKCRKKKSYGALTAATIGPELPGSRPASGKRTISQGYLEELERCNLPTRSNPLSSFNEDLQNVHKPTLKYQHHLLNEHDTDLKTFTNRLSEEDDRKNLRPRTRISQRSKLTAFVTEDNKICYEKS